MTLNNKTVLITGADGFIGSHLTESLVKEGAKVTALSYYNSFNSWGWLEDIDCLGTKYGRQIMLNDKTILITGGTGSFGQKCTEIIFKKYKPKKLIIFCRDELIEKKDCLNGFTHLSKRDPSEKRYVKIIMAPK
jgi:FlaA1/EpsC-like NDP-sugar epimerase